MSQKGLKTLIRLQEWQVDERRRRLGDLMRLVEALENQIIALQRELAREQQVAASSPNMAGFMYGHYIKTVIARRAWIEDSIAKAEQEVEAAREEVREAFQELKKFDIALEGHERKDKAEEDRLERLRLDEIGLQSFRQRGG